MKSPFYKIFLNPTSGTGKEIKEFTDLIDSFDYEDCIDEDDRLSFKITTNDFNFLDKYNLQVGSILDFQYGYIQGLTSALRKARITDIDVNYSWVVTIDVKAYDLGTVMKKTTEQTIWKNKKASDIANDIAKKYGLFPKVEATQRVYPSLPQGNKTDFQFLKYLASVEENGSYRFFIKDGDLIFNKLDLKKESKRLYMMDKNIISFKPSLKESKQKSSSNELTMIGFDPTNQKTIKSKVNDENVKEDTKLGKSVLNFYDANGKIIADKSSPFFDSVKGVIDDQLKTSKNIYSTPSTNLSEVSDLANSKKKANTQKTLVGTLTIEGDPTLSSDEIITIGGVAKIHSGNWYIEKIKHTINNSGYTTVLELSKNAVNAKNLDSNNGGGLLKNIPETSETNNGIAKAALEGAKKKTLPSYDANGNRIK